LNVVPGDPVLRNTIRVWDYYSRKITKTITIPGAVGLMDVKLIPNDRHGTGITAGMFDGFVYSLDPDSGTATTAFDCDTITPHIESPVRGGMTQIMAYPIAATACYSACSKPGRWACWTSPTESSSSSFPWFHWA
jgi:WD40 repeat protein